MRFLWVLGAASFLSALSLLSSAPADDQRPWSEIRRDRQETVDRHLRAASKGYRWFADAMHGEPAGTPFLVLKLLPELDPDIWGAPEENFARFGFIPDPADPGRPLPLGLGWVLDPVNGDPVKRDYHSVTLTCAACHVGRVETEPGQYRLLVGAPNTEVDVRKFRRAVELTVERHLSSPDGVARTAARLAELVKAKPDGYHFYGGRYGISAPDDAAERKRFEDPAFVAPILADLARRVAVGRATVEKQLATSYSRPDAPPLDGGSPGQSDGSGDLLPKLVLGRELAQPGSGNPLQRYRDTNYPELPNRLATVTDNPSVWRQGDRSFGQWDGSIRAPIVRNVAAQTAVVGSPRGINIRDADITAQFNDALPPSPYPFEVDMVQARRGERLFRENCAACHRPRNETLYSSLIDTDMNRARVLSPQGKALLLGSFLAAIPKEYVATRPDGTTYKPADLPPDQVVNDRTSPKNQGYIASPLDGIWARAPYLHNGSIPTLRHLLAPRNPESRRPEVFVRGVVRYDRLNVGFEWDPRTLGTLPGTAPTAVLFDTRWDGVSNRGHQRDVVVDEAGRPGTGGRLRRLDWSGPEHRTQLEELLEYLKTL